MRSRTIAVMLLAALTFPLGVCVADHPSEHLGALSSLQSSMVYVERTDGREIQGRLERASDDDLVIATVAGERSVPAKDVRSVAVKRRWTNRGALIGAVVGVGLGSIAAASNGRGASDAARVMFVTTVVNTAFGATIGALIRHRQTVYRAP